MIILLVLMLIFSTIRTETVYAANEGNVFYEKDNKKELVSELDENLLLDDDETTERHHDLTEDGWILQSVEIEESSENNSSDNLRKSTINIPTGKVVKICF